MARIALIKTDKARVIAAIRRILVETYRYSQREVDAMTDDEVRSEYDVQLDDSAMFF